MKQQILRKLILDSIDKTSSIMPLYAMHYSIFQIMQVCHDLEKQGYISYVDERRVLSEKGKLYLTELKNKPVEIEPFEEYKIDKINVDDIYLP